MTTYLDHTNSISVEKLAKNTIQKMWVIVTIKNNYYCITIMQTFISSTNRKLYTKKLKSCTKLFGEKQAKTGVKIALKSFVGDCFVLGDSWKLYR